MNCQEFEREWAALEDSSVLMPAMEAHRQLCRSCSEMVEDLHYITEQARQVRTVRDLSDDPPERLWPQIRQRLEQDGLIRQPKPRWFSAAAPRAGWFARLPMGLAYAAVFLIAVAVMYLHNLLQVPAAPPLLAVAPAVPAAALERAASSSSDQDVTELAQRVPPEHRAVFVSSWNQVNSSIDQWNDFLDANPGDPFAREGLINSYQQKEFLRETMVQ